MKRGTIGHVGFGGNAGMAVGAALAMILAAKHQSRTTAATPPTREQVKAQAKRSELEEWNAAVEARKAEKRARKQANDR